MSEASNYSFEVNSFANSVIIKALFLLLFKVVGASIAKLELKEVEEVIVAQLDQVWEDQVWEVQAIILVLSP